MLFEEYHVHFLRNPPESAQSKEKSRELPAGISAGIDQRLKSGRTLIT
jgi:hypothetical protein